MPEQPLWIELPPHDGGKPRRLIVILHDAAANADLMMPIAIAWQLKFPGALVSMLDAPTKIGQRTRVWYEPSVPRIQQRSLAASALEHLSRVLITLGEQTGLGPSQTVLIGFGQGADLALEHARRHPSPSAIIVAYAGRLLSPLSPEEALSSTIHLIHGDLNSVVPLDYARQAQRQLEAIGASVTLDVIEALAHDIDQDVINLSTWRVMRSIFQGREKHLQRPLGPLH